MAISLQELFSMFSYAFTNLLYPQIKLADKQAALEKIHWEMITSNKKVEKLQEELDSVQTDISSFTLLLEGLAKTDTAKYTDDYDTKPYVFNHAPDIVSLLTFFQSIYTTYTCTHLLYIVWCDNFNTPL
jgi:hypothetical protein